MNQTRNSNQGQAKANEKNRAQATQKRQGKAKNKAKREKSQKQASVASAYATAQSGQGAKVQQTKDSIRVVHREFIGNVTGTALFTIAQSIALNPGLAASFPWLSGIAQNWETYKFHKVRLCSFTRTGSNVPGSILLAHDPDASDAAPANENVMSTYESLQEDAPWKDICLTCRPAALSDLGPRKFVRTGALAANQDIKLYDSGNLFVGTVDGTAVSWSKLWIEYDVSLHTPQLPPAGIAPDSGTMTTAAGTVASPLLNGVALGALGISALLTTVTVTGLSVGQEYQISYANTSGSTVSFGTLVGLTLKTSYGGGASGCLLVTYIATAVTASLNITASAGTTNVLFTVAHIPVSAF